ncbi:phosphoglycerate mutase [Methanobrevibacter arboriphilus JCM 13429 = DSM 1125]|uniref:phosphoglycerate mutase (2,3-diphosphoglycerate-independent) n=1 Tax=Methanobrevibacter arboriphilus JCM 13429 = DSM 1125 TaxID=1300164 RepID=A0A1V6N031_METAZ|nr:cofactor-independent phosphoglycerate mutase [Methanobrevibacter arboriphilus]OQD57967.1 phosphoglycerate mutase [Methanobrevibacter arboriphilus JCM 13429 = DSM 1125]
MKYIILIGDGMSDYPISELKNKTPLEVANKPNIDELTRKGKAGQLNTVPNNFEPGSDVANMSIFGYNPQKYYTGRGPLEAGSMGIETSEEEVIFRCNLITEKNGKIDDFNAGHITSKEAAILINDLNKEFLKNSVIDKFGDGKFYSGISYRHLFVKNGSKLSDLKTTPPHDIVGQNIDDFTNWSSDEFLDIKNIMLYSKEVLENHPINQERIANNKKPANMVWLWGQGLKPSMPKFQDIFGLNGSVITGVDLLKGIGVFAGLNNIDVPGATGYFDTDYKAKGKYASDALENNDFLFVHVEAPDEAGHAGSIEEKIKAIERIDKHVLGQIMNNITDYENYKIAILPDHATPIDIRTHTRDPVPLAIYSSFEEDSSDTVKVYTEKSVIDGSLGIDKAYNLVSRMII